MFSTPSQWSSRREFLQSSLVAGIAAIGGNVLGAESAIERKGPLTGLPSKPGRHLEKIKALGDDKWLNLGAPAPDPKWGRALGRSWSPRMPYAPDLRGAFITGEGSHGWVNPKTSRQMVDFWFYDVNAHRWICVHPGTDVRNMDADYTLTKDGFTATKDGNLVPISTLCHSYGAITYDTDLKRFTSDAPANGCMYGPAAIWANAKKFKWAGSPWSFDTVSGKWERHAVSDPYAQHRSHDVFLYI